MSTKPKVRGGALLQFEIDRKRWKASEASFHRSPAYKNEEAPMDRVFYMAKTAVCDTIFNGGTFVLVATPDKITMVQRAEVDDDWDATPEPAKLEGEL